jgi:hypothetical protein
MLSLELLQRRMSLKELRSKEYLLKSSILEMDPGRPYPGGWGEAQAPGRNHIYTYIYLYIYMAVPILSLLEMLLEESHYGKVS